MRIYLIGFMGSGKSTFGKKLAAKLDWPFIDTDKAIEAHHGKTIAEIFSTEGESAFREMEQSYLHDTLTMDHVVISCGGGTPCFFDNMNWMLAHGQVIYLKVAEGHLYDRLRSRAGKRPLIANKTEEELRQYIHDTLTMREAFYLRAHQIIDPTSVKAKFIAEQIRKKIPGDDQDK